MPGYAKTRLGSAIGAEQAAGVYARVLYTYLVSLASARWAGISIELSLASLSDVAFFADAFPEFIVQPQIEGNLGQRMSDSFVRAFSDGAQAVVLTGSDIPGLDRQLVREAFRLLESVPVVLGLAKDGGYYLIGMRAPGASLFESIAWSSHRVLAQTEALVLAQGLEVAYLPELVDMDTVEEYERWHRALEQRKGASNG
jgi:rSAM/selenodomain-associated transferase 1